MLKVGVYLNGYQFSPHKYIDTISLSHNVAHNKSKGKEQSGLASREKERAQRDVYGRCGNNTKFGFNYRFLRMYVRI